MFQWSMLTILSGIERFNMRQIFPKIFLHMTLLP